MVLVVLADLDFGGKQWIYVDAGKFSRYVRCRWALGRGSGCSQVLYEFADGWVAEAQGRVQGDLKPIRQISGQFDGAD